jgi:hypothetical protein
MPTFATTDRWYAKNMDGLWRFYGGELVVKTPSIARGLGSKYAVAEICRRQLGSLSKVKAFHGYVPTEVTDLFF